MALTSLNAHGWLRPTNLASATPERSADADFDLQVMRIRQELDENDSSEPTRVRNILIKPAADLVSGMGPVLTQNLRVTVEDFSQDGVMAFLVSNRSFSGFGDSLQEAVRELMELIVHDFKFYESTPDHELTSDALESKAMLRKLFAE